MKKMIFALLFILSGATYSFAQDDAKGCNELLKFIRMPDTYLLECYSDPGVMAFPTGDESSVTKSGLKTSLKYIYKGKDKPQPPTFNEIEKYYEKIIIGVGGKKLYFNNNEGVATFYTKTTGKDIWVIINDLSKMSLGGYEIINLEVEETPQNINSNDMFNDIKSHGKAILYITFEDKSADIRSASKDIVDQLALMLKDNQSLKVSIEGHAENSGNKYNDQVLSENRAKAVMNAVLGQGIDASKVTFKGWGHDRPLEENNTEEAKFKNRRIEIVKM